MAIFQRILVPVDGSATSEKALDYAIRLAREGGSLQLLHAIDELAYTGGFEYSGAVAEATRDAANRLLDESREYVKKAGLDAQTQLVADAGGKRLGEIVADAAVAFQADLIVAGTHGRRGLGRALLGSGAEQIVRFCPVPVLVVRGEGD
jgi:nucleotide-binding universal stress UspA family protein